MSKTSTASLGDPSFVITGLPRTRSAWFALLLDADHETQVRKGRGITGPQEACDRPSMHTCPVVFVHRDEEQSRLASQVWSNLALSEESFKGLSGNCSKFLELNPHAYQVHYDALLDSQEVLKICQHVGQSVDIKKIQQMQGIYVSQVPANQVIVSRR